MSLRRIWKWLTFRRRLTRVNDWLFPQSLGYYLAEHAGASLKGKALIARHRKRLVWIWRIEHGHRPFDCRIP